MRDAALIIDPAQPRLLFTLYPMHHILRTLLVFFLLAASGFAQVLPEPFKLPDFAKTKKKVEAGDATPTSLSNDTKPPSLRQGGGGIRYLEDTTGPQSGWFELFNGKVEGRELIRGAKASIDGGLEFEYDISKDTYILYEKVYETKWVAVTLKKKWFRAEFTNDARGITIRFNSQYWEYEIVDESESVHLRCEGKSQAVAVFTYRLQKNNLLSDL